MNINGARWWKFDLHTHTPASKDYGKEEIGLQSLTPRQWLLEFMKKEIDCVAVTDHNTGSWIDQLKSELEKMKKEKCDGYRQLYIFPGIEISVNGGVHLLAIFDPTKTSEDIAEIVGVTKYNGTRGQSDGCTELSFNEVVREVVKKGGISIPSHVDIDSGIFIEQDGVTLERSITEKGILAIEVCNTDYIKPQIYKDLKLNLTEIIGSDSHKPVYVGKNYTWVKMKSPNIDALWLALHDGKDGVLRDDECNYNPNDVSNRFFIKNISIKDGAKIGRGTPFNTQFSPWLSTIIGGRGSGKSSIINYMRLVFEAKDNLVQSVKSDFDEFAKISLGREKLGMLLDNTEIRVELWKDGRDIALVWKNNNIYEEHLDSDGVTWLDKGIAVNISERFPIRMFSQKELYEITKNPNVLLNLIDQQFNKINLIEELEELNIKWMESRAEERKIKQLISNKKGILVELEDIKAKMKVFEGSDYKKILEDYKKCITIDRSIDNLYKVFNENVNVINITIPQIVEINLDETLNSELDKDSILKLEEVIKKSNELRVSIFHLGNDINQLCSEWTTTIDELPWGNNKKIITDKYSELIVTLQENGEKNPNAYQNLVNRKQQLENKIKEIEKIEVKYSDQKECSKQLYNNIILKHKKIREERINVINRWNEVNKNIQLKLEIMGNLDNSEKVFRELIRKPGAEYKKDILEYDEDMNPIGGCIFKICNQPSEDKWKVREKVIKSILEASEHNTNGYGKYFIKHIQVIAENTNEDIDRLLVWVPEDKVSLKLVEKGRNFDIETGSAGQRTAAILSLILALEDSPLIIDQPEDDLDTKRITDLVVSGMRKLKNSQQIIIVTHNPNIPVNGGAEQIIHLCFLKGLIRLQTAGALQEKIVRQAVCDVMEGGKEALNNRYYRISKALDE